MQVTVAKGENLAEAIHKLNIEIPTHCGGNGTCGSCLVEVAGFGRVRACKFRLPGTYEVKDLVSTEFQVVGFEEMQGFVGNATNPCVFVGIDIGTTTVAMTGIYGEKTATIGFLNPQRRYGADVMTRIEKASAAREMTDLIRKGIEDGIARCQEMLLEGQEENANIPVKAVVSANTTMQYLLWGYDMAELGKAPFVARFLNSHEEHLQGVKYTALPGISAFVGSDIVSGAIACDLDLAQELSLFLDLGTNGEMLLGYGDKWIGTSTAAGPAFEGSAVARQIHAAGVMKLLVHLKDKGYMDDTGLLEEPYFSQGYDLASEGLFKTEIPAVLLQEDIRDFQMAKAAIRAGIRELAKAYDVPLASIKKVVLAGGMGYFIDPADAIAIGLLPEEFAGKVKAVGNSSLAGAVRVAVEEGDEALKRMEAFAQKCQIINLAEIQGFEESYVEYMNFATATEE